MCIRDSFIATAVTITARRAFEIINMNRRGEKPESLTESVKKNEPQKPVDLVEQESLTLSLIHIFSQGYGDRIHPHKKG